MSPEPSATARVWCVVKYRAVAIPFAILFLAHRSTSVVFSSSYPSVSSQPVCVAAFVSVERAAAASASWQSLPVVATDGSGVCQRYAWHAPGPAERAVKQMYRRRACCRRADLEYSPVRASARPLIGQIHGGRFVTRVLVNRVSNGQATPVLKVLG